MNGRGRRREISSSRRNPSKQKLRLSAEEVLESKLGFDLFTEGEKRLGWLLTLAPSSWEDQDTQKIYSCVDLFFVCQDGSTFKAKNVFRPYFYVATKACMDAQSIMLQEKMQLEVDAYLRRRYESEIANIEIVEKEDLNLIGEEEELAPGTTATDQQEAPFSHQKSSTEQQEGEEELAPLHQISRKEKKTFLGRANTSGGDGIWRQRRLNVARRRNGAAAGSGCFAELVGGERRAEP
ncbi:DNA polymerase epsilon catalytic subunit A [Platanthera guangdongensis]|uniref:DNA polymerase epsilon catalytic subunit n=1 Tax=Platanthera guangdongensis TaxID=2320717 RepID=A0ABR2MTB3_9ASPA